MRDEAVAALESREMFIEPFGDVIRVENGELSRFQSVRAHHAIYIHEMVRMLALPHGAAETAPTRLSIADDCD